MKTLAASLSILTQQGVMLYLLRGVAFTCIKMCIRDRTRPAAGRIYHRGRNLSWN